MRTISVVNQKGGCGKTITAVNLAAGLSRKGLRVLLVDFDPQAHATFALGKENALDITGILEQISQKGAPSLENLYVQISDTLYFIPSSIGLVTLEQRKLANSENKLEVLSTLLNQISENFDYCIIDCPPNLGLLTLNAMVASQYSIIPMTICDFSLRGVELIKNIFVMLKEFRGLAPVPFYLLNQVDTRSRYAQEFIGRVKDQLGDLLLNSPIRANIHLKEAASNHKHIFDYRADSRGAMDFQSLAEEVVMLTHQTNWTPLFVKSKAMNAVYVVGDFTNWQKDEKFRLRKAGEDIWSINVALGKGRWRYKFVDGDNWFADPLNKESESDPFGGKHSVLVVE